MSRRCLVRECYIQQETQIFFYFIVDVQLNYLSDCRIAYSQRLFIRFPIVLYNLFCYDSQLPKSLPLVYNLFSYDSQLQNSLPLHIPFEHLKCPFEKIITFHIKYFTADTTIIPGHFYWLLMVAISNILLFQDSFINTTDRRTCTSSTGRNNLTRSY